MQSRWRCTIAGWMLLAATSAGAAAPEFLSLQAYSMDEGLSQASVTAMVEDDRGFLWVGTQEGLNRFDGHHFTVYRRVARNGAGVPSGSVNALAFDSQYRLWIGSDDAGVAVRDLHSGQSQYLGVRNGLSHRTVLQVLLDPRGGAWIGTANGIDHIADDLSRVQPLATTDAVVGMVRSGNGMAFAVDRGCELWTLESQRLQDIGGRLPQGARCVALQAASDGLWLATAHHGLFKLGWDGVQQQHLPASALRDRAVALSSLTITRQQRAYIGYEDGVVLSDALGPAFAPQPVSFDHRPRSAISTIYPHSSGVLWIGSQGHGLFRARTLSRAIRRDLLLDSDIVAWPTPGVRSIWRDVRRWLVGTDQGLVWREAGQSHWQSVPALGVTSIRRILPHPRGGWWIGSHRGLWHLEENGTAREIPGLPDSRITDLLQEGDVLWVATRGGLARVSNDVAEHHTLPAPLAGQFLTTVMRDRAGPLWIGTNESGLFRLHDDGRLDHLNASNRELLHDSIWSLHQDDDAIWMGTFGGGLHRLDRASGVIRTFAESAGFSNDVIYCIEADNSGRLWLSSNQGLNVLDPASGRVQSLLPSDGLRNLEFNSGASFQDSEGRLYFGGTEGLDLIEPTELDARSPPATPVPTELRVLARQGLHSAPDAGRIDLVYHDEHTLDYRDSVFSIGLVAIDFTSPDTARLRYRLNGVHDDWILPQDGNAELLLSYLPSGTYQLDVQAAGRDGSFGPSRSLMLHLTPPPWRHPLAQAAYVLLGLALLAWAVSRLGASSRAKRAQIKLLNRIVAERTQELERANQLLRQSNEQLELATRTDPLTQVSNRRDLQAWLEQECRQISAEAAASGSAHSYLLFCMVDIDDFKRINDTHGHQVGDEVLVEFAQRLRKLCRDRDVIVRWGGEEFLLLVRDAHLADAPALAERLRRVIADSPIRLESGQTLAITCSIGFAPWPLAAAWPDAADWEQSVSQADRALYAAKGAGKNAWVGLLPGPEIDRDSVRALVAGAAPATLPPGHVATAHSTPTAPAFPRM